MSLSRLYGTLAALLVLAGIGMVSIPYLQTAMAANNVAKPPGSGTPSTPATPPEGQKTVSEESAAIEIRRQQLTEREAALAAKEQELKRAAAGLDAKIKELTELRKTFDEAMKKKKADDAARQEKYKKILKVYKGLKPADAGKLIDSLEEELAIEMLNQMDQKTAIKLIPFLNQPRVLKWTRLNLRGQNQ